MPVAVIIGLIIWVIIWVIGLTFLIGFCQEDKKKKGLIASVLHKYDSINPNRVTEDTIKNFHDELYECFTSDKEYYLHVNGDGVSNEISRIDNQLNRYMLRNFLDKKYTKEVKNTRTKK